MAALCLYCITTRRASDTVVDDSDITTSDDLAQSAGVRITDFDIVVIEEQQVLAIHDRALCLLLFARVLHDQRAAEIAVLIDIHSAVLICQDKLVLVQSEHAKWSLITNAAGDVCNARIFEDGNGHGLLLVQRQHLDSLGRIDGDVCLEDAERITFDREEELVKVAEGVCTARGGLASTKETRFLLSSLVVERFKNLEGGVQAFFAFVKDQRSVLHLSCCEVGDILGEPDGGPAGAVGRWRSEF